MTMFPKDTPPSIAVSQSASARNVGEGLWEVSFQFVNATDAPATLLAAWLPHGRFRSGESPLDEVPSLEPGGRQVLGFLVAFQEPPGTEVENAFVILRLEWRGGTWRVLARLTVTAGEDGAPRANTELVTAHRVGFAGQ